MAFDILFINDVSIGHLPLYERLKLLQHVVYPIPQRVEVVEHTLISDPNVLKHAFFDAIQRREEGVVVKCLQSSYQPFSRRYWMKLKTDYFDELCMTMNVAICGARFSLDEEEIGG